MVPVPLILVAEDDEELRALIVRHLRRLPIRVVELEDGLELSDYIALTRGEAPRAIGMPNLLLTDLRMPGASGIEVIRLIRALGNDFPILILTAFPDAEIYKEAARLGDTHVLRKPIDLDVLAELIANRLDPEATRDSVDP